MMQESASAWVLAVRAPVPALGLEAGDRLVIRPGHREAIIAQRVHDESKRSAIAAALDLGELEPLTDADDGEELAAYLLEPRLQLVRGGAG